MENEQTNQNIPNNAMENSQPAYSPTVPAVEIPPSDKRNWLKILVIIIGVLLFLLVVFWLWLKAKAPEGGQSVLEIQKQQTAQAEKKWQDNLNAIAAQDKDFDNLTDVEEAQYKTNANDPDTDDDGFLDGDEIKIFKTNPNNPDTDGDGTKDGVERKMGTDPLVKNKK
jgi:hypothetical protein